MTRQNYVRQDDEVIHIEDTLRSEVLLFIEFEHITNDCTCSGKRCPHCNQWKCRGAFGINRIQKDGLQPYCRTCRVLTRKKPRVELHVEVHVTAHCACRGKRCPVCQQVKCDGEFYPTKQRRRGLLAYCRICHKTKAKEHKQTASYKAQQREYMRFYQKAHADKVRARKKDYYRRYREQILAYRKLYGETHTVEVKRQFNAYYRSHREYFRERGRLYRQRHPEKHRERSRIYYQTHREASREQGRAWRRNNPGRKAAHEAKRRARKAQAGGSFTIQQWLGDHLTNDFTPLGSPN